MTEALEQHVTAGSLGSAGFSVLRGGLAITFLWIGAMKFTEEEIRNAEVLVTASPLTSRLRQKTGAESLRVAQAEGSH